MIDFHLSPNPNDFASISEYLYYLYNNLGYKDLRVAISRNIDDGRIFSRHVSFEELDKYNPHEKVQIGANWWMPKQQFLEEVSHRSVLDIELVFDIDEVGDCNTTKEKAVQIVQRLIRKQIFSKHRLKIYHTGNKGYHIHGFMPQLRAVNSVLRQRFKVELFSRLGTDTQKSSSSPSNLIAIEGRNHWKSGVPKREVNIFE